jgi:hypothetical protein
MNRTTFALVSLFTIGVGVQDARAQVSRPIEFTTAFPFTVGETTVAGGTYSISADALDTSTLEIRGRTASVFELARQAKPSATPSRTEVVFERYGDHYILKSIWIAGATVGFELNVKFAERHLERANERLTEFRVSARVRAQGSRPR